MHRSRPIGAIALLLVPALRLGAQAPATVPPPPDSVVRAALAAIQSGDSAARARFVATALSPRARAADSARVNRFLADLHAQGAPFTVTRTSTSGRSVFVSLLSARAGRAGTLQVGTDRQDPSGVGTVAMLETHAAVLDSLAWPAARPADPRALAALIDRNVARLVAADAFTGVVHVESRDGVVLSRGYGLANREDSVPNTPRTRFALASMPKMLTAVAALQLVERGKARLDDTLASLLPAYPNAERARRITLRHLLQHTSGMGDMWSTPKRPVPGLTGSLAAAASVAHAPLLFEPGTRWSYSNEGYEVLAAIVEALGGRRYADYVRDEILAPAGMTETVLAGGSDDIISRRAVGYRSDPDDALGARPPRANWSFIRGAAFGGAGGGYSTVGDLAKFGRALRDGRLLGKALRDSMWTGGRWSIPGHEGETYGLGSFVRQVNGRTIVGHGGGGTGSGMDSGFRHFTDGSWTVVVLGNVDPPAATWLTSAIVKLLASDPLAP